MVAGSTFPAASASFEFAEARVDCDESGWEGRRSVRQPSDHGGRFRIGTGSSYLTADCGIRAYDGEAADELFATNGRRRSCDALDFC